ncbi:SAM-dependent methyltransferase [Methylacidiphilum kamchatkense Kam1]|uniref:SAM-dependent methyltransferase n=1 Tax=Methylacidiphilum kamchatkense Kam1 TaxID=1202785 RepID=A0A0C1UMV2_9BACT|nr:class I SAM-dependent methyltransferase [Methylacidiphilum kamchatkense]KIE57914.1 SAM-dependent methyltransferase [Methylacidiphilum kamchatkense Kam1]QDQ42341.1 ubiquinone/menaquinone biosynthesis C-methylase UbiE [Methylacidiphilum kamchatkense Kam1]
MSKTSFEFPFNPLHLFTFINDTRANHILKTAFQLHIFKILNNHKMTLREIANITGASLRGLSFFLDGLTALGLLEKDKESYQLSSLSKELLVEESQDYIGDFLQDSFLNEDWKMLTEAVLKGGPPEGVETQSKAEEFFPKLIRFLHILHRNPAVKAAQAIIGEATSSHTLEVLDIGCGSAVWSLAIALANKQTKVTAVDFPKVLAYTQAYVQRHGMEDRYEFLAGNIEEIEYPQKNFNLVIFGHILHSEGENKSRRLFKKIAKIIDTDGRIAILEFLPNRQRTEPIEAVLFGLRMLVNTKEGGIYSAEEYEEWLREVGFTKFSYYDIGYHSPLIVAAKK